MENKELKALEKKIDELLKLCGQLNQEVKALQANESGWRNERGQLLKKNDEARAKVEAMILRLKALEQES
jgi:cell division protein ZapB